MTPDRWQRISNLLDTLLALSPAERRSYLTVHCQDDPVLRREVVSLLESHEQADSFLENPASSFAASFFKKNFAPPPLVGQEIRGYRIMGLLGEGGVGHVYKAVHIRMRRLTALKFLHPYLRADERAVQRFIAEAQAASALDHPNICQIYTVDETLEGYLFIAMAYYEGETIKQKIAQGPLPLSEVLNYAFQITSGLRHAHAQDVIHRDVKPANILVTSEGVVKILDFGLAQMADMRLTQTGRLMGTPAYMSPEHIRGQAVATQTDVWSLGIVLYEMLTGKKPFHGEKDYDIIESVIKRMPPPLRALRPETPKPLANIVDCCLLKDTHLRLPSAEEVYTALSAL